MMLSDDSPLGSAANMPASGPAIRVGQGDALGAALDRLALGQTGQRASYRASGHQHVSVAHQVASLMGSLKGVAAARKGRGR